MLGQVPVPGNALRSNVRSALPLICLLAAAALIFIPVVNGYWLADDFSWVRQFYHYRRSDVSRLFLGDWSRSGSQEYRPLWAISFMIDLGLWGADPAALHVMNIMLHLIVCALIWGLVSNWPGTNQL